MAKSHYLKRSIQDRLFDIFNCSFMIILMFVMVFPFWNTIVVSLNEAIDGIKGNLYFWPRVFTFNNYTNLFRTNTLVDAFYVSVSKTIIVTLLNVFFSALAAYILSRRDFVLKKILTIALVVTLYLDVGLIPQYFNFRDLGLINNYMVYIVPGLLGALNVIVIRTFIYGLPESLAESAKIDGAGEFRIFVQIIIPLCKPILATVALWVAVGAWNSWFDTYIFASSKQHLSTLQYEMMKLLSSAMIQSGSINPGIAATGSTSAVTVTPNSVRSAITIIAALPIIFIYPFLQKYFVAGLVIGGVKG
ncbi:MAG: carbohydrate ABC transporter permease [Clostridiaceae bacterium]|nr:carbohydrate ABC transporter permease [Clostridiaceae bacterium]